MAECCPRDSSALAVELYLRAIAFGVKISHDRIHVIGGHTLSALDALVDFQLELCQYWHNKEISMEVGKGFFQQADLELWIILRLQQMCPYHCLVKIRGDLCHEQ